MMVIKVPGRSISATVMSPELNAMAFGGVDTGRGIASEHAKAVPTSSGETGPTFKPRIIGIIKFEVAVLLITELITQATLPNATINPNVDHPSTGKTLTIQSASPLVEIAFPRHKPPPINNRTSQESERKSSTDRILSPKNTKTGRSATVPVEYP